ncbi:uncharacterized protein LOC111127870 [Crassostrea virginica]
MHLFYLIAISSMLIVWSSCSTERSAFSPSASKRKDDLLKNILRSLIQDFHDHKADDAEANTELERSNEELDGNLSNGDGGNDDEGDVDDAHDYMVLGKKGDTNAAHDKRRNDHIKDAHKDKTEAVIQEQEEACNEYHRQKEMAIKHGRNPEEVPSPSVPCEMTTQRKRESARTKRFATLNPGIWDHGIVPYQFDADSLSDEEEQMGRIRAHNHYEYWTCLRFVPYTETTQEVYGLSHNNYLRQTSTGGCWSFVGNLVKKNGQNINCCKNDICVHELGHAFGLNHEQKNPLNDEYLSVHYSNIQEEYHSQYYESNIIRSQLFGYYDMSNVMHYGLYGFTTGGPTMSVFDKELEYLVRKTDPYQYYLFSEVSKITDCKGIKCSSVTLTCENAGYPAFIKNQCTCRCPEGLDPAMECRTRYDGDRMMATKWPSESFTILSTVQTGCPSGFYEGGLKQHHKDTAMSHTSSTFSADIISEPTSTTYKFCTKKETDESTTSTIWPTGKYCVYRQGGKCPEGFSSGYIQYDDMENPSDISGILPDGQFSTDSRFYFCCRSDGSSSTPIDMPSDEPFILFPTTKNCQEVLGMKWSKQYLRIKNDVDLFHTSGDIPYMTIAYTVNYNLYFCYYTALEFDETALYSRWPSTAFTLLQSSSGCPKGFESGQVVEHSYYSSISTFINDSALTSSGESLHYHFCTKPQTTPIGSQAEWGPGSYCILRAGGFCPNGFKDGMISMVDSQPPSGLSGVLPDGTFDTNLVLQFCCRNDGFTRNPLLLPNKEPFILYKNHNTCQKVEDMSFEEGTFYAGTKYNAPTTSGHIPQISISSSKKVTFYTCYYYPTSYDCGETIHLSQNGQTSVDISSPGYPNSYPAGRTCFWNVIAPSGYKLKLDFDDFNIVSNSDGSCEDRLEIKHTLPGQFGLSYCGDRFENTVITEENQLGLTFQSSLRNSARGFSVKVVLLNKNGPSFCYTKKGENYRGTVDITRNYAKCLPWTETKNCLSSTYNPMDLDDDLLNNYCRNPGHGTRPWCITNKYMCTRGYCDVCGIEKCHDIFNDCAERVSNALNCDDDPELQRGCRLSCNLCDQQHQPIVGSVTCNQPEVPRDATSEVLKDTYSVDETVEFTCETNSFEKQTATCLTDGSWSNSGFTCGRCRTGWVPYRGQCYKAFYDEVDRATAETQCSSENSAILASSRDIEENNFLTSLVQDGVSFWIGLKDKFWADGEPLGWTNYNSGDTKSCAYITDGTGKWKGSSCNSAYYIPYVCSYAPQARKICEDASPNCLEYLNADARACTNDDFVWHRCPKTCGYCNKLEDRCSVLAPSLESNAELVTPEQSLGNGEYVEYRCKSGYSHTKGDLFRACKRGSGSLTGDEPVCEASNTVPERNNDVPLVPLGKILSSRYSYTGLNDMMEIKKSGKIVQWQFYSETNGIAALQVWRRTSVENRFSLIGQNEVSETYVGRIRTYVVPVDDQINVRSGDLIGIYFLNAEIPYERCNPATEGERYGSVMKSVSKKYKTSDWTVSSQYDFVNTNECRIIPLTAHVR